MPFPASPEPERPVDKAYLVYTCIHYPRDLLDINAFSIGDRLCCQKFRIRNFLTPILVEDL